MDKLTSIALIFNFYNNIKIKLKEARITVNN